MRETAQRLPGGAVAIRENFADQNPNDRPLPDRMRSNESLAGTLATLEVQVGWRYLNDYLERIEAVTPADILAVAQKYVRRE